MIFDKKDLRSIREGKTGDGEKLNKINFGSKTIITMIFSLFLAWLFSFPFEGKVLYALAAEAKLTGSLYIFLSLFALGLGLCTSGFFAKRQPPTQKSMLLTVGICLGGSLVFFFPMTGLWYFALVLISFLAGVFIGWWGFYLKEYATTKERKKISALILICSRLLMIATNLLAKSIPDLGLSLAILYLLAVFLLLFKLDQPLQQKKAPLAQEKVAPRELLLPLCAFILFVSINSGFMYRVVKPAFSHFESLANFYGWTSYILALVILRILPQKTNRAYLFDIALKVLGISWLLFLWMDRSIVSYLLIESTMMGALGVFDLFLFCILGSILDYAVNPAHVLGMGLALNVLGILLGGILGQLLMFYFGTAIVAAVGLLLVFASILLFPPLNVKLTGLLEHHLFLIKIQGLSHRKEEKVQLTGKEQQIVELLLHGYTYKAIAEALFISENTLKYHTKNLYRKLKVNNKMDLIKLFGK